MKNIERLIVLVMVLILTIFFSGCANNDLVKLEGAVADLQMTIEEISTDRDDLLDEIAALKEELESTSSTNQSIIYGLRSKLEEAEKKLIELQKQLDSISAGIVVSLADEYTLVVGDNFQLFYRSVVQAPDPYGYYIKLEGKKGHAYNRYYEFNPEEGDIGTHTLKLSVCDANGVEYGSDTTTLKVVSSTLSSSQNVTKNILCFGDSLTANGVWVAQGVKRYKATGYTKVKTLGSMSKTLGNVTVNYEGNSGWEWKNYIIGGTDLTTGKHKDSPFKASTGANTISFKEYATKYGVDQIDELYILLTWNNIGGVFREFSFKDELFSYAKMIIDKFHEEFPNGKVTLIGIPKPSTNAGLGAYDKYNIGVPNGDNYGQSVTVMNYNKFLEEWTNMEEYSSFLYYADGMGQFDSEYNMPSEPKPVNNQSSITEPIGTAMGIHPNNDGYMQIGDVFFRALMADKNL